jgi:hypothetical protein
VGMITLEAVEAALTYLGGTVCENARCKSAIDYTKHRAKVIYATIYMEASISGVAGKQAVAQTSPDYEEAMRRHRDAAYDAEIIRTKRKHAELTIDVWRSINAGRSKGQII